MGKKYTNRGLKWRAYDIYIEKGKQINQKYGMNKTKVITKTKYRTRAIITRGLYTFYPLFEVHLCTVTFGLMYG